MIPRSSEVQSIPQHFPLQSSARLLGKGPDFHTSLVQEIEYCSGKPICNLSNTLRILECDPEFANSIWFDEFYGRIFSKWRSSTLEEWTDNHDLELTKYFQREIGFHRLTDDLVRKAVSNFAKLHVRNEPRDWMNSLKWDGVERIHRFFIECLGAEESDYTLAAASNWWISMAARIFFPGAKVDTMPILEGRQGNQKSSALALVGGKWYAECHEEVTSKDFYLTLQGKLVVEISELYSFSTSGVTAVKKVISCNIDRYRVPYGRHAQDFPRQCVFAGTTNEDEYFNDPTGARRFWPIRTGTINLKLIEDIREQLFAEAVAKYRGKAKWWEMPEESTLLQQQERQVANSWDEKLGNWLVGRSECTMLEILELCLNIEPDRQNKAAEMRVANAMKRLGWEKFRRGPNRERAWRSKT